jgi:fatty-acid desaturase
MDTNELKEEKICKLFSESLKLKLELFKVLLTFTSIAVGIEVYILSNSIFDFTFKLFGGIIVIVFLIWMALYINDKMHEVDARYLGF